MAERPDITPELCRQLLRYEPETGRLFWQPRQPELFAQGLHGSQHQANAWNAKFAGLPADDLVNHAGYRITRLFKRQHRAHRLILAMATDCLPSAEVDHINGDRTDNRLINLRWVTKAENTRNQGLRSSNSSGVCGVYWNRDRRKWQAYIRVGGKMRYLGLFAELEHAAACRRAAELEAGFHENHGRRRSASCPS